MDIQADPPPVAIDKSLAFGDRAARRRLWAWAGIAVIAPLFLVACAALTVVLWLAARHQAAMRAVEAEVARIQSAGEPITIADRYAHHRVPDGIRDITALWQTAMDSLTASDYAADAKDLPIVGKRERLDLATGELAAAEQFLARHDATVRATLAAAAAEGQCRFPARFEEGMMMLIEYADQLRILARLMQLRERVAAARGNGEQALESIEAMLEASETLAHQLTGVEQLVRQKIAGDALREVEYLLNESMWTDAQLGRLSSEIQSLDFERGLTSGIIGERAGAYFTFHHPQHIAVFANSTIQNGLAMMDEPEPIDPAKGKITHPLDCKLTLDLHREVLDASRSPFPKALAEFDRFDARWRALTSTLNPVERSNSRITLAMFPAYSRAFEETAGSVARRDLTLCAIAAERFRLAHGRLPQKLDELVPQFLPAVPTDPFDGQPLRMKANAEGLVFYSVGKDRKDDGGVENENRAEPDNVVTLKSKKGVAKATPP